MKSTTIYITILVLITGHYSEASVIDGYTDKLSYRPSETVTFFISGDGSGTAISLDNFDGTFVLSIGTFFLPTRTPIANAWLHGFGYSQSFTWQVPSNLQSGYYLVNNKIPIIIKEANYPEEADIVVVIPTNTLSAYNGAGGESLYSDQTTTVSFLRPFDKNQEQFTFLRGFINWLRTSDINTNYSISYISDKDMDDLDEIINAKLLIIPGHSEYWTRRARLNFDRFVDNGISEVGHDRNAVILSGNTMWWQVRYEDDNGNPQLICHRGWYDNDPIADPLDPNYDPLLATYHWGEPSLKYSIIGSIGSDWLRGGYGVDIGTSVNFPYCYGGYNGFKVTLPNSPVLNGLLYDVHDFIHFATGEYDGTLVQIDNDGNFIPDANGDPQLDVPALGFYRAEMIGYDEIPERHNQAGNYPDPGNPDAINICPFMIFQKTCTSGTTINVNSNQWCSNWVIGHGQTGEINPQGNGYCGTSATCVPDQNIPQITDNMINLMMADEAQNLHGNSLFVSPAPSSPSFIIKPAYTNVSYNICSGGLIDITPCGVYETQGYKLDHGFRWKDGSIEIASTNLHNTHYSDITSTCTDYNNGLLARPHDNGNTHNATANTGFSIQILESNGDIYKTVPSEINIFPNPTSGNFILKLNRQFNNSAVTIYNSLSEVIFKSEIRNQESEIDLSASPKGIYFLKVTDGDRIVVKKIVKI